MENYNIIKNNVLQVMKTESNEAILAVIRKIVKLYIQKQENLHGMYVFFSMLYDDLYHDILTKKIKLEKKTIRILEFLASPLHKKSWQEQHNFIKKILN